ncbi:MAG TPA: leucyl aminopeptidase family protein [Steroidobacter sp.]|uniref:leucyl aminopeptidase family protein n=1 Tax=Steroidobacter sp. TaxID=1978227 RepID=UPI002ED83214
MATTNTLASTGPPPFLKPAATPIVSVSSAPTPNATAIAVAVFETGKPPNLLGFAREQLTMAGFKGEPASTLAIPRASGPIMVAAGMGAEADLDTSRIRDSAAAFALLVPTHGRLAFHLEGLANVPVDAAAQAVVEGILLARYEYFGLRRERKASPVDEIVLVTSNEQQAAARAGAALGQAHARATILARDLANTPHSHLSATRFAELATKLGEQNGFDVQIFGQPELQQIRCGGLLAVNAGSVEPPCMIKLFYRPERPPERPSTVKLALVGKGIMYDSGGISLKPSDPVHARMKNDMSGAAAVLATIAELRALGCPTAVTGYLMCTDNMPSGTATALGDVFTTHGGKTVEVFDTDAEGRLVMCDALELAAEEKHDAIVDIATLTGSCARALGSEIAGVFANERALLDQIEAAAKATGEPVWHLPLHRPYRKIIESDVADLRNCGPVGKPDAIVAALYLSEFVGDVPWAHIDICGTAWNETDALWQRAGCSGFGARLMLDLAMHFTPTSRETRH